MAKMEHDGLAAELKRRSPSAWATVYDRHVGEVFGLTFHLVGSDRALAEELAQETWLAGLEHIDQFDCGRGTLRSWLFGIARQQVALHFRRRSAYREECRTPDLCDAALLPDDVLEQVERASAVRAALVLLDDAHRAALIAKYVEGLSVGEIAAQAGKSEKAMESVLTRARAEMRNLLRWYFAPTREKT